MKNVFKLLIFALVLVSFNACDPDKKDNPKPGDEDPGSTNSRILWTYDVNQGAAFDDVPALDAQGNIFAARKVDAWEASDLEVFSLDKNGHERWKKAIPAVNSFSKVVYKDNKVFFLIDRSISVDGSIYCLDANTGEEIWVKTPHGYGFYWGRITVADNRIYTFTNNHDILGGTTIDVYDFSGNKLSSYPVAENSAATGGELVFAISVKGSSVYYGLYGGEIKIGKLTDTDGILTANWVWDYPDAGSYFIPTGSRDLPLDDDGNAYISVTKSSSENKRVESVFCVGANGVLQWRFDNQTDLDYLVPNGQVTVDADGVVYANFREGIHAIAATGDELWYTENSHYDPETNILNLDYQDQPTLAVNGNSYHHDAYGFVALKGNGSMDWKYQVENEYLEVSDYLTITPSGDFIIMGSNRIVCVKGDGSPLATGGWAKRFGDLGNTCSKP